MKISIAMAVYNGEKYILEQLESFERQTVKPDEIIITDDKSTDDTIKNLKLFKQRSNLNIKIFVNDQNLGYSSNFNKALSYCTGDLIFLSDQDDVWFPKKIEEMKFLASDNNNLLFMNDAALTNSDLKPVGLTKLEQIKSAGLGYKEFVMGCCCCIKKEFLSFALPMPESINAHDNWLVEIANSLKVKKVHPKVLQYYRRHDSNESNFIGNSLTKATLLERIKRLFNINHLEYKKSLTNQLKVLRASIDGLNENKKLIPFRFERKYNKLISRKTSEHLLLIKRINIINGKSHFKRINLMILFFVFCNYKLKNLVKDAINI